MELKYIVFLQNADDSITKLKLKHDLHVVSLDEVDAFEFVKNLDNCSINEAMRKLAIDSRVLNFKTRAIYLIEKEFDAVLNEQDIIDGNGGNLTNFFGKFQQEIIFSYIEPLITALRLFKEGDLAYWNSYFYNPNEVKKIISLSSQKSSFLWSQKYSLLSNEAEFCNEFINNFVMPESEYLKLAIEQFNNSYVAVSLESSFLNLMMSLEALYTKSNQELSFRLRRNCAILLGTNYENSQMIFRDIKELYDKRNKLIHGKSKQGEIKQEDVHKCSNYVRSSIKKFIELKEGHDELLNKLDTLGFGQFEIT